MKNLKWGMSLPLSLLLLWSAQLSAQLEVTNANTPPFTPVNLVENIFLGEGTEVLNVTYTGDAQAVGFFDGENSNIGIDRGILMTSGRATNAIGPNNDAGTSTDNSGGSDLDLENITGLDIFNAAVYEITFIPYADNLTFNYVFASEEYDEFVCAGVNDAFAFLIQGPGFPTPTNIALIPGTTTPVTIDNVNNGGNGCAPTNVQYYINNDGGATVQYDAFTTVLQAEANVIPCETYTIKLAIGDAGDGLFDSGVFLQANSFGSAALEFEVATMSPDTTIREGCSIASLNFVLAEPAAADFPLNYTIGGTAQNGVDYTNIPLDLVIPAGQTTFSIEIEALEDGIAEGVETIDIEIATNPCSVETFTIYIEDNTLIDPILLDTMICEEDSIALDATIPIVLPPPFVFSSDTPFAIPDNDPSNPVFSPITVTGIIPSQVSEGTILSVCIDIDHPWDGDLDVFLVSPNGQFIELTTDNGGGGDDYIGTCFTADASVFIEGLTSGDTPFTGDFFPEAPWSDLFGATVNGTWNLQVSDDTNGFTGTLNSWSISFPPVYNIFYDWTPTTDISCTDCAETIVYPSTSTDYVVVAMDSYGCEVTDTASIEVQPLLPAPDVTCNVIGGTVTFEWTSVPGNEGYEISLNGSDWMTPADSLSYVVNGMAGDTFSIEVHALEAPCEGQAGTATCIIECDLLGEIVSVDTLSCYGGMDGGATVSYTGGTEPVTFDWGDGQTTATATGLTAGNYIVSVTDAEGCIDTISVDIPQPDSISIAIVGDDILCNGTLTGSVTATAGGGTGDFTFQWDDPALQTTATADGLAAGTYNVTVTDENACSNTASVTLTEAPPLSIDMIANPVTCKGGDNGVASANVTGGTTYTYNWSDGQTTAAATGLTAGTYTVTATNGDGCTIIGSVDVTEPADSVGAMITLTHPACNGDASGSIEVNGTGGGPMIYGYALDGGPIGPDNIFTGLTAGDYLVHVTDIDGCDYEETVTLIDPDPITASLTPTNVACNGGTDGSATVDASGGTDPLTYLWSDPAGQTTTTATGLANGTYTVTITDANGCTLTEDVFVGEPDALMATTIADSVSCNGLANGMATVIPTGGDPFYMYQWDDPAAQTGSTATGLAAGTYNVTVTDQAACSLVQTVEIGEPPLLELSLNVDTISCSGGTEGAIATNVTGGTLNYSYSWNGGETTADLDNLSAGSYTVTVTDANGCTVSAEAVINDPSLLTATISADSVSCNGLADGSASLDAMGGTGDLTYEWNDMQSTAVATGLAAGMYYVTVTDANGCFLIDSVEVGEPLLLTATISADSVSCNGLADGSASLDAMGGSGVLMYQWDDPAAQTTATATGLVAGTYNVTVTDANGCSLTEMVEVGEPELLETSLSYEELLCNGDVTDIFCILLGGTPPYTYEWQDGADTSTIVAAPAGTYTVTVTDANGCTSVSTVTLTEPDALATSVDATTDLECLNDADGTATISATGGVLDYTFDIGNGVQNDGFFDGLSVGDYTVTVTDANGCTIEQPVEIVPESTAAIAIISPDTAELTCAITSIDLDASVSTSLGPLNYEWADGSVDAVLTVSEAGLYTVLVTDAVTGCTASMTAVITQDTISPTADIMPSATELNCSTTSVDLDATGSMGAGNIGYLWSDVFGTTDGVLTTNNPGDYTVTITDDDNGCTASASVSISQADDSPMPMITGDLSICDGASGTLDAGAGYSSYAWSGGGDTQSITVTAAGIYTVTVTNAEGCEGATSITVTAGNSPVYGIANDLAICAGGDAAIGTTTANGTTYAWTANPPDPSLVDPTLGILTVAPTQTTTYTLTATAGDCEIVETVTVTVTDPSVTVDTPVEICGGETAVLTADVSPQGGDITWMDPDGNVVGMGGTLEVSPAGSTSYLAVYQLNGCQVSDVAVVNVLETAQSGIEAAPGVSVIAGTEVTLTVTDVPPGSTLVWTTNNGTPAPSGEAPVVVPTETTGYTVEITTADGCVTYAYINIFVEAEVLEMANAFTPNGDEENDYFYPIHNEFVIDIIEFKVFDRWGVVVHDGVAAPGWDGTYRGKPLPSDIYVYLVRYSNGGVEHFKKGDVALMR